MAEPGFNRRALGLLIGLSLVAAALFVGLSLFGADLRPGGGPAAGHAASTAATGYSALVRLADAAGQEARVGRSSRRVADAALLVVTPAGPSSATPLAELIRRRNGAPILIVLPKWQTLPRPGRPGWADVVGVADAAAVRAAVPPLDFDWQLAAGGIKPGAALPGGEAGALGLKAPRGARWLQAGRGLDPVLSDAAGRMLLGWHAASNVYLLADPDLINNGGLRDPAAAQAAVKLLALLADGRPGGILFDVTANGLGTRESLWRAAFEPPLLGLSLALLLAGLLAGWFGLMRFGTAPPPPRAIAFGKRALVENMAALIRMAGREAAMAPRYAALVAEAAAARLRAPAGLAPAARTDWLEARAPGFAALAAAADQAATPAEAVAAAQALHRWREHG